VPGNIREERLDLGETGVRGYAFSVANLPLLGMKCKTVVHGTRTHIIADISKLVCRELHP
jgi:hypothetical protein